MSKPAIPESKSKSRAKPESRAKPGRHPKYRARRSPQQERSKNLVKAVRQAGRLLLEEGGAEALTTSRIAERAGVSVGSLYQYFENKEAIVKAVYDESNEEELLGASALLDQIAAMDPRKRIRVGIEYAAERHRRMLGLDAAYYREHHGDYRITAALQSEAREKADRIRTLEFVRRLLDQVEGELAPDIDLEHASFLLGPGISALLRAAIEDDPARLSDEHFLDEIEKLFMRYLYPDH